MLPTFKKISFVLVFGAVIFGSAVLSSRVFSYNDTITHPSLTENITKIYNKNSERKLTAQEIEWLKQGSIEEDKEPRWMNHFYDPLSGKGPWGFLPSKIWAQDSLAQSLYKGGDQTWQKAISSYAKGNNEEAFFALGHILHLLEDATVPAHTRLDAHPEGDPYEVWARDTVKNNISFDVGLFGSSNLNEAFDKLAIYSSTYFLSKDTIDIEKIDNIDNFKKIKDGVVFNCKEIAGNEDSCLITFETAKTGKIKYVLDSPIVHSDYFSLLAPKAVSYGAGVVKLFIEEAEKQKKLEEQKSWWEKLTSTVNNFYQGLSGQFGSLFAGAPYSAINTEEKPQTVSGAENNLPITTNQQGILPTISFVPSRPPTPQSPIQTVPLSNPSLPTPPQIQEEILKPEAPPQATEEKFNPIPPPQTFLPGIGGGPTSESQENVSSPPVFDSVSTTTPAAPPEVSIFLSDYQIASRRFAVNWQSSSTDIISYELFKKQGQSEWQEWEVASTSESLVSKIFDVPQDETVYYFRIRVINSEGIASEWKEISAPISFYPIVINEIAWAGTGTSSKATYDEWIEIYNKTAFAIDILNWQLVSSDSSGPRLVFSATSTATTTIPSQGFYLIERTDDSATSELADWFGSFGNGLGNNPNCEILSLYDEDSNLIDQSACASNNNWLAGTASPNYQSMERVNPYLPADIPGNWQSNNMVIRNGLNVDGQPINGTPKAQNSVFNLEFFYLYPLENTVATSTNLAWTKSSLPNLQEYRVVRAFDAAFASSTTIATIVATNFQDTTVESETNYHYKISACDNSDYCVFSNSVSTTTPEFPFSWSAPQIISGNSTTSEEVLPDIALLSNNQPAVIWYSSTSTANRYIKFSQRDSAGVWSEPINISQDPAGYEMQILSKENRLEVLYSGWGPKQGGGTYFDVFSVRSENGIWQPAQNISQEGTNNSLPAGTIDSSMTTHIVWQGLSQSSSSPPYAPAIFYRALDSSGSFLKEPEEILSSTNGVSPGIIIDSQNKLHVFWCHRTPPYCDEVFYSINSQDGLGWSQGKMIFDGKFESTISGRPQILLGENNQFLLAWQQRSYEIAVTKFDGLASTTEKIIFSKASKQASTPSLIVNNSKKPYVFWSHGSDTGGGIYFSWKKQNGQWQEIKTALEKPQPIMWARAVIDSNNIAHLVWGNDLLEIYYTYGKIE